MKSKLALKRGIFGVFIALGLALSLTGGALAAPSATGGGQVGVFGTVAETDGSTIVLKTNQGPLTIVVDEGTMYIIPGQGRTAGSLGRVAPGDRLAVMAHEEDGTLVARSIMVMPRQATLGHVTGVVAQVEDGPVVIVKKGGEQVNVELPEGATLAPGRIVTVVGTKGSQRGRLRAKAIQSIDDTLARLQSHLGEIGDKVRNKKDRVKHITRLRHLLEQNSDQQLKILNSVIDILPEEAQPALEHALRNLQAANEAVVKAFGEAMASVASEEEGENLRLETPDFPLTLADLARILGLDEAKLDALIEEGLSLAEVAAQQGISRGDMLSSMIKLARQRIEEMVGAGQLDPDIAKRFALKVEDDIEQRLAHKGQPDEVEGRQSPSERVAAYIPFDTPDMAAILDMEPGELKALMQKGLSLVQIAEEQGISQEHLVEAIMKLARERANELVKRGLATSNEVQRLLKVFREQVSQNVRYATPSERDDDSGPIEPITPSDIAAILGTDEGRLAALFQDGGTFGQVVKRLGKDPQVVLETIVSVAKERLHRLVEEGQINEEQAEQLLESIESSYKGGIRRPVPLIKLVPSGDDDDAKPLIRLNTTDGASLDVNTIARVLAISPRKLFDRLQDGKTLVDIARSQGLTEEGLVRAALEPVQERLVHLVEKGQMSKDQMARFLASFRTTTFRAVREFHVPDDHQDPERLQVQPSVPGEEAQVSLSDMAKVLDLNQGFFESLLKEGLSPAQIAKRVGIPPEELLEELVELREDRLEDELEAGSLSREQFQKLMAQLEQSIWQQLNTPRARPQASSVPPFGVPPTMGQPPRPAQDIPTLSLVDYAEALGMDLDELKVRLGVVGLGNIARERGLEADDLADRVLSVIKKRLVGLVEDGRLTSDQMAELLQKYRDQVLSLVRTSLIGATSDPVTGGSTGTGILNVAPTPAAATGYTGEEDGTKPQVAGTTTDTTRRQDSAETTGEPSKTEDSNTSAASGASNETAVASEDDTSSEDTGNSSEPTFASEGDATSGRPDDSTEKSVTSEKSTNS